MNYTGSKSGDMSPQFKRISATLDTYSDVFAMMNSGAISLLDNHLERISPVMIMDGESK